MFILYVRVYTSVYIIYIRVSWRAVRMYTSVYIICEGVHKCLYYIYQGILEGCEDVHQCLKAEFEEEAMGNQMSGPEAGDITMKLDRLWQTHTEVLANWQTINSVSVMCLSTCVCVLFGSNTILYIEKHNLVLPH